MVADKGTLVIKPRKDILERLESGNDKRCNVSVLIAYIERIQAIYGISSYRFQLDNNLSRSFMTNLRRMRDGHPSAYKYKLSFDMLLNLSLRYGVPFLASDYLDTLGNYPNNYLHKKTESHPNKQPKKTTKAPPKPKFI